MRAPLLLCLLALASSCGHEEAEGLPLGKGDCGCAVSFDAPWTGEAVLTPHEDEDSYLGSVVSFRWATTVEDGRVGNDWDLSLVTSTTSRDQLTFRVNLVTDDRSCIEDLGTIAIAEVPPAISSCDDHVQAVEGHVYLVQNRDPDQQQYAAFALTRLDGVKSATLRWYRSSQADRFSLER